mmetsp:Transcript_23888/g.34199  ORF Transcript_23888/g.34199 Transcript_23888/m.34199 type:complete len:392 (+) Transcript_23888:259-1434(+)
MNEFDYIQEAHQLDMVRTNLIEAGLAGGPDKMCVVPKPHIRLCRKRVLVMEELKGSKLIAELERNAKYCADQLGEVFSQISERVFNEEKAMEIKQGPTKQQYERMIFVLNKVRQAENASSAVFNNTLGRIPNVPYKPYTPRKFLPLNHAKLIDNIIYIHGHEVMVNGAFNGDPHPGNILLLGVDEEGEQHQPQLGLIDYGQVPILQKEVRLKFCELIIALSENNRDEVVRLMKELGYKSRDMNGDNMYLYAKMYYDEDNEEITGGKHIQMVLEELQKNDPIEDLPRPLLMVGRVSTMIRGLAHSLKQSRSMAKAWKPIAERVLREEKEYRELSDMLQRERMSRSVSVPSLSVVSKSGSAQSLERVSESDSTQSLEKVGKSVSVQSLSVVSR